VFVVDEQMVPDTDGLRPWATFEHLVRTLRIRAEEPVDLVARVCTEAVRCIPAAQDAGVILSRPEWAVQTVYATGPPRYGSTSCNSNWAAALPDSGAEADRGADPRHRGRHPVGAIR
jgi:hypothetical protein